MHLQYRFFLKYFRIVAKEDSEAEYISYTFRSLPLHLDNVPYEYPAGVTMLHCLR